MAFNLGENVGPYRVKEQLGRGGMATVYKAYHANLDRYVALKVLHPAFLEDENFLARFQREARLVAKLEHPNIVPVYDFAEHEGQPYLVMKFVEGETLKALINRGQLSVEQIWAVVDAVGAGLAYAHKQGILHRDIKPSNVIVADDGQMYLADFGLARIAEMGESTLSGDMIMGTPQYISPEQAMGVKDLDGRTDIYSFAVILYEMVVGQVPFSADTPFSIIHDHIYSPLPLPKTVNPSVPEEVERVLLKALAKERDDRYQSVPELVQAFKDAWDESDVDIAEVTMTKPIAEVASVAAAAPALGVGTASVPGAPSQTATRAQTDASQPVDETSAKKSKKKIWLFGGGAVALACICLLAIGIIVDRRNNANFVTAPSAAEPREEVPLPPDVNDANPALTDSVARVDDAELQDLMTWVAESPEDPYAHLALSLAFFDNKDMDAADRELRLGTQLAGDDIDFYYDAGYSLIDREAWGPAAGVFMRALQNISPNDPAHVELLDLYHESLYKAAAMPGMLQNLPVDELERTDLPMFQIAKIRNTYYHGDPAEAWQRLEEQKQANPRMVEARLLEAEMNLRDGNRDDAAELYISLVENENTPFWIFEIAADALERMQ